MPASVDMAKAEALALAVDKELRADDPRFSNAVQVIGDMDGTVLFFTSAFAMVWDEDPTSNNPKWLFVFTEHYGCHVFDAHDSRSVMYAPEGISTLTTPR